jgi:DNA repair protein SbcD/Mre11
MKIVHAADLHIDSPFRGLDTPRDAVSTAFHEATRRAFSNLIDLCLQSEAAVLLLAGDIFDGDCRDAGTGEFFLAELDRLREVGTRAVLVCGNHDAECAVMRDLSMPEHLHCLAARRPETLIFDELGVAVHGQSYWTTEVWENLAHQYPARLPDLLNLGLLHTNAIGYVDDPLYAPCTVDELVAKDYDYWALGHLHTPQVLHADPWVVYPGNLQARYMEEAGPKGCVVIECQGQRIQSVEQVPLDVVRWVPIQVQAGAHDGPEEVAARVQAALQQARTEAQERPVVARVVVEHNGAEQASRFDRSVFERSVRDLVRGMEHLWIEQVLVRDGARTPTDATAAACAVC